MLEQVRLFFDKSKFALFLLLWVFLYFARLGWLARLPWVQVAIGIVIFALPGIAASIYLAGKRLTFISHCTSGIAISIFFVGTLGFLGRVLHLPFAFIKPVFFVSGLLLFFAIKKQVTSDTEWYKPQRFSLITVILLILALAVPVAFTFLYRFQGDDFSYLAYLTNWQHAQALNFREVLFNTGQVDSIRFWLAMLPMNFAFLSELSNVHGVLLMGSYLEPFLVVIAVLATYNLYEDLFQSNNLAISALLLQLMFLIVRNSASYTGIIFFNRLSHDKSFAAFILVPIFFLAIRYLLDSFGVRSSVFVLLIGLSLTLTHPVILAFALFIAGVYIAIETLTRKDYKKLAVSLCLLAIIVLPAASTRIMQLPIVIRYIPALAEVKTKGAFDLEAALNTNQINTRITYITGTPFYGFNVNLVRMGVGNPSTNNWIQSFFAWSYLWLLGLGLLWAIFNLKKHPIAPFIAATCLLIALAAIPYTGWLIGYFVSARLLLRAAWMMQFGLIGTVLLNECFKYISSKITSDVHLKSQVSRERVVLGIISLITIVSIGVNLSAVNIPVLITRSSSTFNDYQSDLRSMAAFGDYLEQNLPNTSIVVAPPALRDYLPGLSSKAKPVFFRMSQFSLYTIDKPKTDLLLSLPKTTSDLINDRINTLLTYHIGYIVTKSSSLKEYYIKTAPDLFQTKKVNGFWLIEFQKTSPK